MKKYLVPIAATLLVAGGVANANPVKTSNEAVTLCKSHIKANVPGFQRVKLSRLRSSRLAHKVTFAVTSDGNRARTTCVVNKQDGAIALNN